VAEEKYSFSPLPRGEGLGVRAVPTRYQMVTGIFNGDSFNVRAEAAGFVGNNRGYAVHSSLIS
jgi:hypothetical protein